MLQDILTLTTSALPRVYPRDANLPLYERRTVTEL